MSEIAEMLVSAGWEGTEAERGLDRLGLKFDQTVDRLRDAQGRFVGLTTAQQGLARQTVENSSLAGQLTSQLQQGAQAARDFGVALTAGVTLPLAGALSYIIAVGSQTSQTLNQFEGTARASREEMERVRAKARELGADLLLPGTSSRDAARAMLELNKGGLDIRESMDAARGSIQLARAAIVSEAEAAKVTANALNTYKLAGDQAGRVSDVLANAANKSTGDIMDFAQGLAQAGLVAHSSNVPLEETTAVLSLLANAGLRGSDAGTSFKTFLLALRGPSDDARAALTKLFGKESPIYDGAGRMRPLVEIIDRFKTKLDGLNQSSRDAFLDKIFGSDGARVAIALFGEGREEFERYVAAMSEAATAQRVAEANTRGLRGAWDGFLSTVETLADDIFDDLEEPLTGLVRMMTAGVSLISAAWQSLGPGVKSAIAGFLTLLAALGPVITVAAGAASAFLGLVSVVGTFQVASAIAVAAGTTLTAVLAPLALVALKVIAVFTGLALVVGGAVAALFAAWSTNFLGIRDITYQALGAISDLWNKVWPEIKAVAETVWSGLGATAAAVLGAMEALWRQHGAQVVSFVRGAWEVVSAVIVAGFRTVRNVVDLVAALIRGDWQGAWRAFVSIGTQAAEMFGQAVRGIGRMVTSAIAAAYTAITGAGLAFSKAAFDLGKRLITSLALAIYAGKGDIADAIMTALAYAVMATNAQTFGQKLWEAFKSGFTGAAQASPLTVQAQVGVDAGAAAATQAVAGMAAGRSAAALADALKGGAGGASFGGGGGKGGGGGESPAVKAARAEVERLKIIFDAVKRVQDKRLSDEDYFYAEGLRSAEAYRANRETIELNLFNAAMRSAQAELAAAKLTRGAWQERQNAINAALERIEQLRAEHNRTMLGYERDAFAELREVHRTAWANETARLEEVASGMADIWQRLADGGVRTFFEAEQVIYSAQLELLIRERQRLENELAKLDPQSPLASDLRGQIATQDQRIEGHTAARPFRERDSRLKDFEVERGHADGLRGIWEGIEQLEFESQQDRLRILEAAGMRREEVWKRELALELERERVATARRVNELRAENERIRMMQGSEERKRQLIEANNKFVEAEERRSAQVRANILEDYYAKQNERLKSIVEKTVGILNQALERAKTEGARGFFRSLAESFRETLLQMTEDLLKSRLLQLMRTVFKVPAPGSTQGQQGAGTSGDFLSTILGGLFGRGGSPSTPPFNPNTGDGTPGAVQQAGERAVGAVRGAGEAQAGAIRTTGDATTSTLTTVGQGIVSSMLTIASSIAAGSGGGGFSWKGLFGAMAMGAISGATNGLSGLFFTGGGVPKPPELISNRPPGLAGGGLLEGPGHGTSDNILGLDPKNMTPTAWVSPGEFVVNAAATARNRAALEYINSFGELPHLFVGGMLRRTLGRIRAAQQKALAFPGALPGMTVAIPGGGFGFTPPHRAKGGIAGADEGMSAFGDYVPPVNRAAGGAAVSNNNSHYTFHVTVNGGTGTPAEDRRSARQIARESMEHLRRLRNED